ncbi:hypothetical protein H9Y04_30895 [Streptomyces sp. TRM66268-LWL]|uniref:Lipoprotein n=1 Tax=Streptomyces polyasparticus TaxID=2767826 RepID=A0ABR7SQJ6_9ACTN|nr:hypothetical protein [Streptomyces polyasparticus]MBC9716950.1 hypothetical protein [Streptomyces polyasparticus]
MKRTLAATAALVVVAVGATACGAGSTVDTGAALLSALTKASDKAQQAGSAEVAMVTEIGQGTPVTMDGTFSWGEGMAYDVQMDAEAAGMGALADGEKIRALLVDGAYYYNVLPQSSGPLDGVHWAKVEASAVLGEEAAAQIDVSGNPVSGLRGIKDAKDVEKVGEETVLGKKTTHYKTSYPADSLGGGAEKGLANVMGEGFDEVTLDVWLDDQSMPVRIKQDMGALKMSMDFKKFGATKKITAPPANDTGDMSAIVEEQLQGS